MAAAAEFDDALLIGLECDTLANLAKAQRRFRAFFLDETEFFLNLSHLGITSLPRAFFASEKVAARLESLDCGYNRLETLPSTLGNCVALNHLCCSFNQLLAIPDELGECVALMWLYFECNQLEILPDTLGNCTELVVLGCADNQLATVPDALDNCAKLQVLSIQNNPLADLPETCQGLRGGALVTELYARWASRRVKAARVSEENK